MNVDGIGRVGTKEGIDLEGKCGIAHIWVWVCECKCERAGSKSIISACSEPTRNSSLTFTNNQSLTAAPSGRSSR